jgi:hypothetical protein
MNGYLSISTLGIGGILEGIKNFFEGDDLLGLLINGFPDNAVGSFTEFLKDFEFAQDVRF